MSLARVMGPPARQWHGTTNTTLDVGNPIAHTPKQAMATLKRSTGLHRLVMIGCACLVWDRMVDGVKDGGASVRRWLSDWTSVLAVR